MRNGLIGAIPALGLSILPVFAEDLIAPIGEGPFDWQSYEAFAAEHDFQGQELDVVGLWTGLDKEMFEKTIDYFELATGATVNVSGAESNAQDIVISTTAGSPPDLAIIAQPGVVADLARRGHLTPLREGTADWVRKNYAAGDSWVELGSFAGPDGAEELYGFFYRINVTSLVWYVPENFEENGYEVPESIEELQDLMRQIVEDGGTPWCIGLAAGPASGWPGTDWVEDLMLRLHPGEVYDQWVKNEIAFDDPRVVAAMEEFEGFMEGEGFVNNGTANIAGTDWRDAAADLFELPTQCYLMKQPNFIISFFPNGVEPGRDFDFFYFPTYESKDLGRPVLGSGTQVVITKESDLAHAFVEFLKTPIAHETWMAQSGFLTPHLGADPETFSTELQRQLNEILTSASSFALDASDQMPPEIGANAFWSGMVDLSSGKSAADVAADIQSRWARIE